MAAPVKGNPKKESERKKERNEIVIFLFLSEIVFVMYSRLHLHTTCFSLSVSTSFHISKHGFSRALRAGGEWLKYGVPESPHRGTRVCKGKIGAPQIFSKSPQRALYLMFLAKGCGVDRGVNRIPIFSIFFFFTLDKSF